MFREICRILLLKPTFLFWLFTIIVFVLILFGLEYGENHLLFSWFTLLGCIAIGSGLGFLFNLAIAISQNEPAEEQRKLIWILRGCTALLGLLIIVYSAGQSYRIPGVGFGDDREIFYFTKLSRGDLKLGDIDGANCNTSNLYLYLLSDKVVTHRVVCYETICVQVCLGSKRDVDAYAYFDRKKSVKDVRAKLKPRNGCVVDPEALIRSLTQRIVDEENSIEPFNEARLRKRLSSIEDEWYQPRQEEGVLVYITFRK